MASSCKIFFYLALVTVAVQLTESRPEAKNLDISSSSLSRAKGKSRSELCAGCTRGKHGSCPQECDCSEKKCLQNRSTNVSKECAGCAKGLHGACPTGCDCKDKKCTKTRSMNMSKECAGCAKGVHGSCPPACSCTDCHRPMRKGKPNVTH